MRRAEITLKCKDFAAEGQTGMRGRHGKLGQFARTNKKRSLGSERPLFRTLTHDRFLGLELPLKLHLRD